MDRMSLNVTESTLPIHFFTIVLNGEPFIRYHIEVFKQLPFKWYWHIIEGVADLKHDTAWSLKFGGRITEELHQNGLSNDGTTEYLDELIKEFPENITIYRKPNGIFWDGKLEMVNAPLININEECLLWQVDADELWRVDQICAAHAMFMQNPEKTAAYYYCHYFVGKNLIITTRNTYGNYSDYEWLRTWRFQQGDRWFSHAPPCLCRKVKGEWMDVANINPFTHTETELRGLVFQHYAYVTEAQLQFKERYYGYQDALKQWQRLQEQKQFPIFLKDYFSWVKDDAEVNTVTSEGIWPIAQRNEFGQWRFREYLSSTKPQNIRPVSPIPSQRSRGYTKDIHRVLIVRPDSIGDFIIFTGILPYFRKLYPGARISLVIQHILSELAESCPYIDEIISIDLPSACRNQNYLNNLIRELRNREFDVAIYPVYSRSAIGDLLTITSGADERITFDGDNANISEELKLEHNRFYTRLVSSPNGVILEPERYIYLMRELGIEIKEIPLPSLSITKEDIEKIDRLMEELRITEPIVIAPFPQTALRRWPLQKWVKLLSYYKNHPMVICGTKENVIEAETIINLSGSENIHNLCGRTKLRELAVLLSRAQLYIGVESGVAHMATAVGCPNVVIIGGGHYGRFMPYSHLTTLVNQPMDCYHCNWKCRHPEPYCITQIKVERVDRVVRSKIGVDR